MKNIEERFFVENFTANVEVPYNFYEYLFLTPLGPFQIDGGVFWSCGGFYFVELWRTCVLFM